MVKAAHVFMYYGHPPTLLTGCSTSLASTAVPGLQRYVLDLKAIRSLADSISNSRRYSKLESNHDCSSRVEQLEGMIKTKEK